jgi:hypothetical protein
MTKPRNGHRERKAREIRELLNEIDPYPVSTPPPPTPSPAMSLWKRPTYKPEQMSSVRSGANDHQRYKSRGM